MKKRFLATLLAMCMVVTLIPAFGIPAAAAVEADYTLYLNDEDGKLYKNNTLDEDITDEMQIAGAEVGGKSGARILTLKDFNFITSAACALQIPDGTTIVLEGTNTITSTFSDYGYSHGILSNTGVLAIRGAGSLTATGGSSSDSIGIKAENITISGRMTLDALGNEAGSSSCGIYTGSIAISDSATVNATSGTAYSSTGICKSNGQFTVSGNAILNATSGTASGSFSEAIFASNGSIAINDNAVVTAKSGDAKDTSSGISSGDSITISGSAVLTAVGGKSLNSQSNGISTIEDITVSNNAKLTAIGGIASEGMSSIGLFASGLVGIESTITLNDNAAVTATGGIAQSGDSYGIFSHDSFRMNGSASLAATGGTATDGYSCGIYISSDIGTFSVSGNATITATGGTALAGQSYGILSRDPIRISSSATLTATGGTALGGYSYGVFSNDDLTISDNSTLTATGGEASSEGSCGMFLATNLIISGGTLIASAKTYALEFNYPVPSGYRYSVSANQDGTDSLVDTSDGNFAIDVGNLYAYVKIEAPFTQNEIVISDTKHGAVSVNNSTPTNGQNIIVTASPEDGYELYSLIIAQASGNRLPYTDNGDGTYTFNFTSGIITITAKLRAIIDPQIPLPFADVKPSDWFYSDIQYVYSYELFNGISDTIFEPNTPMTRGMMVTVLGRLSGINPDNYSGTTFDDVNADTYYSPYIKWASERSIVNGVGDNRFSPDEKISRQDLATIIYRYSTTMGKRIPMIGEAESFSDENLISDHALYAVYKIREAGIINGKPGNIFDPLGNATRAEVAAMLHRFTDIVGMD